MTRLCVLLALAGLISVVAGVAVVWSPGAALIVGGGLVLTAAVLLYDPKATG